MLYRGVGVFEPIIQSTDRASGFAGIKIFYTKLKQNI